MGRLSRLKQKLRPSHSDARPVVQNPITASTTPPAQATTPTTRPTSSPVQPTATTATTTYSTPQLEVSSAAQLAVSPPEPPSPSIDTESLPPSLPERLWNKAYDGLIEKEPDRVNAYEEILDKIQKEWTATTTPPKIEELEQCKGIKSRQMWQLVYAGLDRSKKQAKYKESVSTGIQIVDNIKEMIDKAVKSWPQAGLAWAGVCLGLEILSNPTNEEVHNRNGIAYVLSRMEWYWNLADLILDEDGASPSSTVLRSNLESHVVELYKNILLFQMRSVCLYYRNWLSTLLRDAVKLDDWVEKLKEIKDAESLIGQDFEQYSSEEMRSRLRGIERSARSQEKNLESIYSAIQEDARKRQRMEQDDKDKECLAAFEITDPRVDKKRIQARKGHPLWDSYHWVLEHSAYERFTDDSSSRVLWINGEPGKGKTMLLCGIIDELKKSLRPLSYFFCQATVTEADLSSDTAVMRGLIYVLLDHQPSLISKVRRDYDKKKEKLFNSINSSVLLGEILTNILQDPSLHDAILVVDALDECKTGREGLAKLIVNLSSSCRAKWIVSSRNWPEIERELSVAQGLISLELEKNNESVAEAVRSYIRTRVGELAKHWDNDTNLKERVFSYMVSHADSTFLWVALVCEKLADSRISKRLVLEELERFPEGLLDLYNLMMERILASSEADRLKRILATACVVYRPLTSKEMKILVKSMEEYDESDVKSVIGACGSFLKYQDGVIYFVHQSAKDFLLKQGHCQIIPLGVQHQHSKIFLRSLEVMKSELKQNIYDLNSPGTLIDEVSRPDPDPLISIEYLCVHWPKHLIDSSSANDQDGENFAKAFDFLREKPTAWIEALSLLRQLSVAVTTILNLESALRKVEMQDFSEFIQDARRFVLYHRPAIETAPLQVYASALIFSPKRSKIREQFGSQAPKWIIAKPEIQDNWESCIQTLNVREHITAVAHSPDGRLLAITCFSSAAVYDATSGDCIHVLRRSFEHGCWVGSAAFSPDGNQLAVSFADEVEIFQVGTFDCTQRLDVKAGQVLFSPNGDQIGMITSTTTEVWDLKTHECIQILEGLSIISATFLPGGRLATGSEDSTVKIWNLTTGNCQQTLKGHMKPVYSLACSPDEKRIATASGDSTAKVWHLATTGDWICKQNPTSRQKREDLSGSGDGIAKFWDISAVSPSRVGEIKSTSPEEILDFQQQTESESVRLFDGDTNSITNLRFSPAGKMLVSDSIDGKTTIWDVTTFQSKPFHPRHVLRDMGDFTTGRVAFDCNDCLGAILDENGTVRV
ncbi:Vegetative incompatibility protein HET-E-1 [Neonectria ditissima]|uniref:Vegetative incompatibility protein HET-E-1 n=1 Tax=Neonectria ditissima TaxID=78410 RepID=A0A0P7BTV0_9HYPO|nr:Vegetative incompatibility protein HET-E-1 [Neonectria ditissima]